MSPASDVRKLLKHHGLAYLHFDAELKLTRAETQYSPFFEGRPCRENENDIWDIFPELVGSENIVEELRVGKRKNFLLEQLNSRDKKGRLFYYTIHFFNLENSYGIFCSAENVTNQAAREQDLRQKKYEVQILRSQLLNPPHFLADSLLGQSPEIENVRRQISKVADFNTPVLLQGESGTGKSLVARLLHHASSATGGAFVEINCAAIPETLLESELFGYEQGAFTNAMASKEGLLERADGGTLFLDEIGELPLSLQAKLLTFLETRRFRRLGGLEEIAVKVRLIAATNKDLDQAVKSKEFREDLYYRINVVAIRLPAMRELGDDVILMAEHYLQLLQLELKKGLVRISEGARKKMLDYHWPGNVRELRNVIERAIIFAEGNTLKEQDILLPQIQPGSPKTESVVLPDEGISLQQLERDYLLAALNKADGNQKKAAALLDMSSDTLRYRLKKFNISPQDYR